MGEKDYDREREYSPNPDFNEPIREHPDTARALDYAYHKAAGSLGDYYAAYPAECPWDFFLTPEERAAAYGQQKDDRPRER